MIFKQDESPPNNSGFVYGLGEKNGAVSKISSHEEVLNPFHLCVCEETLQVFWPASEDAFGSLAFVSLLLNVSFNKPVIRTSQMGWTVRGWTCNTS